MEKEFIIGSEVTIPNSSVIYRIYEIKKLSDEEIAYLKGTRGSRHMTVSPLNELTLYNQKNDELLPMRKQQESEIRDKILQIVKKE